MTGLVAGAGLTITAAGLGSACSDASERRAGKGDWRAWIHIGKDGSIIVYSPRLEMGQGILTAVGMLVAEELDADWNSVSVRHAPLSFAFGSQVTENSDSVRANWMTLRRLGAAARTQLLRAAASRWHVAASACTTGAGQVLHHATGQRAAYGELAELAAQLPLQASVTLKQPSAFQLLMRPAPRHDIPRMLDGTLKFTSDLTLPGLVSASVLHSPMLGGRVKSIDDRATLATPGVKRTVNLQTAVAVVARDFWSAEQGCRQLKIHWTAPDRPTVNDETMWELLKTACRESGQPVVDRGNVAASLASSGNLAVQEYSVPYQAHATMEPMVCIADVRSDSCEVWAPTQSPWATYRAVFDHGLSPFNQFCERVQRKFSGRAGSRIRIHSIQMGGGFGRRLEQDFTREAVLTSKAVGAPVKLLWTREQDMGNDSYRPASHHRIQAAVDQTGHLTAWHHRIAGSGILDSGPEFPYDCANIRVELSYHELGVPTGAWRSTSHTPNAFARECMIDELAERAGQDPLGYRLSMLTNNPRMRRVVQRLAQSAAWGHALPSGHGRGIALYPSKESFIAQIAEVSVAADSKIRVHRVVCAVDCGLVVNPDTVKAQMEGAIIFGLTATLKSAISVRNGRIAQSNFNDFSLLRINEAPAIEVHLLESAEPPGGIGEPGVPPIAPAVANAVYAATGKRVRQLPIALG